MIVEQGDESWEVEPLSREDTLIEAFYGAESTTDGFELTKVGYDGGGENIEVIKDSPLEDTPDALTLTTVEPRGDPGEDELPVLLNTGYDIRPIRAYTPTGVEEGEDTSKLFFYEGSEGVSLVVIHDSPGTDTGGEATFEFDELPEWDWVVEDGPGDIRRKKADNVVNWRWGAEETDGGAYRFDAEEFSFTLTPSFESGIDAWEFLADDAEEPRRIQLDLNEPVTVRVGGTDRISASATTIAYVPGLDEDEEGYQKSAFPNSGALSAPFNPDDFYGDGINTSEQFPQEIPENLDEIKRKRVEGIPGTYRRFRFANKIKISFEVTGTTAPLNIPEMGGMISNSEVPVVDESTIKLEWSDTPSYTLINKGKLENINSNPPGVEFDSRKREAHTEKRYLNKKVLQNTDGDIVGVRVSTIWGSSNPYSREIINKTPLIGGNGTLIGLQDNPIIYSWIEIIVLSNGARYVRVPDHSLYPQHVGYLDGKRSFGDGGDYGKNLVSYFIPPLSKDSGDEYSVGIDEPSNNVWADFKNEADSPVAIPYKTPHSAYLAGYDRRPLFAFAAYVSEFANEATMIYGRDAEDNELTTSELETILPDNPLDPFNRSIDI
jgi:hypothetical protein